MVNINSLTVGTERKIRETINTQEGVIHIYEPTVDDINAIIEIQQNIGFSDEATTIEFDEMTVLKEFFPLLTNIDLNDSTDEELSKIIANPSIHLLIAKQVIAQIVAEANKFYINRVKTELLNADSMMANMELIATIPSTLIKQASSTEEGRTLLDKLEEDSNAIDQMVAEQNGEEI